MSKRHYYTPASGHDHTIPSDIPFRSDLVFYAPMTEQCCCDYVSGCVPITDGVISSNEYATCEWDNNAGMWRLSVRKPGNTGNFNLSTCLRWIDLTLYSGVGTDNRSDRGITMFCQIQDVERLGNCYEDYMVVDDFHTIDPSMANTSNNTNPSNWVYQGQVFDINSYNLNLRSQNNSTTLWQPALTKAAATVTNGADCKWYKDGVLKRTANNWQNNFQGNPRSVGCGIVRHNQTYITFYLKDVRIYNRVLTQAEIQQL